MFVTNTVEPSRVMTRSEISAVLSEQTRRARRSTGSRMNLVICRLAICCGLRVSEIAGLSLSNVRCNQEKPHIRIPAAIAKRNKARTVPLWIDRATLEDIRAWKQWRRDQGASGASPFIANQNTGHVGQALTTRAIQSRFKTCLRNAGFPPERISQLSIHSGRHSFCSHGLAAGFSLAQIRDWAGHASISTTSVYLHADLNPDAGAEVLESFGF